MPPQREGFLSESGETKLPPSWVRCTFPVAGKKRGSGVNSKEKSTRSFDCLVKNLSFVHTASGKKPIITCTLPRHKPNRALYGSRTGIGYEFSP